MELINNLSEIKGKKESHLNGSFDQHLETDLKSVFAVKNDAEDLDLEEKNAKSSKSSDHEMTNGDVKMKEEKMLTDDSIDDNTEKDKILSLDENDADLKEEKTLDDDSNKEVEMITVNDQEDSRKETEVKTVDDQDIKTEQLEKDEESKMPSDADKVSIISSSEANVKSEFDDKIVILDDEPSTSEKDETKKPVSSSIVNKSVEIQKSSSSSVMQPSSIIQISSAAKSSPSSRRLDLKHGSGDAVAKSIFAGLTYRPAAKLLINMGLELVREEVIKNLIEIQKEKERKQKLDATEKSQLDKLEDSLKNLVMKNEVYKFPVKRCKCSFVAFTDTTLELHRQFGGSVRLRHFRCCVCRRFKTSNPPKFISHMGKEHKITARFLSIPQFQCPYCPFEHRQVTQLERHVNTCHKKFTLSRNLVITQNVFDIPVYETAQKPKTASAPIHMVPNSQAGFSRAAGFPVGTALGDLINVSNAVRGPAPIVNSNPFTGFSVAEILSACGLTSQIQAQVLNNLSLQSTAVGQGQNFPRSGFTPILPLAPMILPPSNANWLQFANGNLSAIRNSVGHPRPILPLPGSLSSIRNSTNHQRSRFPHPAADARGNFSQQQKHMEQLSRASSSSRHHSAAAVTEKKMLPTPRGSSTMTRLDIPPMSLKCEICDLPSRDLESLRLHLVALHRESLDREEFHRKGRTLNCSSCSEKFWTKQGALRHCLAAHGPGQPRAYQCIKCGAKVSTSILNHLSSQHNITVLDMYEAKFCMLCNSNFKTVNQFESHAVNAHADIFPNRLVLLTMIKALTAAYLYKTMSKPDLKPTLPQLQGSEFRPVLPRGVENMFSRMERPKMRPKGRFSCHDCCINFVSAEELASHCQTDHSIKCSRCPERWNSVELLQRHFQAKHHNEKDRCILCGELVQIGRPTVRHIKRMHIRACSVVVKRLHPKEAMRYLTKRRRLSFVDGRAGNSTGEDATSHAGQKNDCSVKTKVEEVMEVDGERIVIEKIG